MACNSCLDMHVSISVAATQLGRVQSSCTSEVVGSCMLNREDGRLRQDPHLPLPEWLLGMRFICISSPRAFNSTMFQSPIELHVCMIKARVCSSQVLDSFVLCSHRLRGRCGRCRSHKKFFMQVPKQGSEYMDSRSKHIMRSRAICAS